MSSNHRFKNSALPSHGMTLVETVVVIAISTLLMLVITYSIQSLYKANSYTYAQAYEIDNARKGIVQWTRDVREMTYSEDGTFPLAVSEPHRIGFYSDVDRDESVEYVEYTLSTTTGSTTLMKNVYRAFGNPPTYSFATPTEKYKMSEFVQNRVQATSTFYYYDTNGVQVPVGGLLTDVRYIRAQIIVNIDPLRSPGEFMLRSSATPRNLKDNL
jgi:type II secretory pathway pseudopilin PulG